MPQISDVFVKERPALSGKNMPEYAVPLLMGIEVEVEGWDGSSLPTKLQPTWNLIHDNSLRDNGVEFVMKRPKHGKALLKSINDLGNLLEEQNYVLSHRCSVHCHIDFRGASTDTLEKFFLLYMLLEPALYTVSSKDRYNNIYCPGLSHTTALVQQAALGFAHKKYASLAQHWNKYTGINLQPLHTFGSVEIRTHKGTGSGDDIVLWTRILNYIYHAATQLDIEFINKVSSPEPLIDAVFPEDLHEVMSCDNLHTFWPNVMLNLQYYKLVPQVLASMPERVRRGEDLNYSNTELDLAALNSELLNYLQRATPPEVRRG